MADSTAPQDPIQNTADEPDGNVRIAGLASPITSAQLEEMNEYPDFVTNEQPARVVERRPEPADGDLSPQISRSTKSVRLEPPPVVMRPPRVKYDGFSLAALSSVLSWNRNEQKDMPSCSRSVRRSYSHSATFRIFGLSISREITYKTSETGIDVAMFNFRLVSAFSRPRSKEELLMPWKLGRGGGNQKQNG